MSKIIRTRRSFKIGDTFLDERRRRWKVIFQYPPKSFLDAVSAYCIVPAGGIQ